MADINRPCFRHGNLSEHRAETLPQALGFLGAMFGAGADPALLPLGLYVDPRIATALACGVIGSLPWLPALRGWKARQVGLGRVGAPIALETLGLILLVLVLLASSLELASNSYNPFIYFRF